MSLYCTEFYFHLKTVVRVDQDSPMTLGSDMIVTWRLGEEKGAPPTTE